LEIIIPTDEFIFFRGVGSTTNQSNIWVNFLQEAAQTIDKELI
jgi:hypothetical protein